MKAKRTMSLLLAVSMVMSMLCSVAGAVTPADEGMTKQEFVEYCHSLQRGKARAMTVLSAEEADQLAASYAVSCDSEERAAIEEKLNAAGIYIYSDGGQNQIAPLSEPADVSLGNVMCYYNSNNGEWTLNGSGHWLDVMTIDREDMGLSAMISGVPYNIGGTDAVGIVLYDVSGVTPRLKESYAIVNDGSGNSKTISNPSGYDTKQGVGFEYQDQVTATWDSNGNIETYKYMGKTFCSVMRFDSDFANWDGNARVFYSHTWKSTSISSISFSMNSNQQFGLNITWTSTSNKFLCYSNSDTRF